MNLKIRKSIIERADKVGFEKTICPSEVARELWPDDWQGHMEEVRQVACELRSEGEIEICQKGEPVSGTQFRGPIRLRRLRKSQE